MQRVRIKRCQDNLGIARHLNRSQRPSTIGDTNPTQLNIVFRGDRYFRIRFVVVVVNPEFRPPLRKNSLKGLRFLKCGLIGC